MSELPVVVLTNVTFPETRAMFDGVARVIANDGTEPWSDELLQTHCRTASGLMAFMTDRIDDGFLAGCPSLKIIGAALKGYDNIDVAAATMRGVWVSICDDLLTVPTAEHAIGLMLALGRNMLEGDREIRSRGFHGWRPRHYGIGLYGSNVGIVGFGKVGQAIASRLVAFGCQIRAYDNSASEVPDELAGHVTRSALEPLLAASDFVVLALPLLASTQHLINADTIAMMKPGALLINPARGSLVDEAAVAAAVARGHLKGYAADVFECEDWARPDRPATIDPQVLELTGSTVLTPHVGSAVVHVRRQIEASAAENIIAALQNKRPPGAINVGRPL